MALPLPVVLWAWNTSFSRENNLLLVPQWSGNWNSEPPGPAHFLVIHSVWTDCRGAGSGLWGGGDLLKAPQSLVEQLRCEGWSRRPGWVRGWLVSGFSTSVPRFSASPGANLPSFPFMFSLSLAFLAEGVRGSEGWSCWLIAWSSVHSGGVKEFFLKPLRPVTPHTQHSSPDPARNRVWIN